MKRCGIPLLRRRPRTLLLAAGIALAGAASAQLSSQPASPAPTGAPDPFTAPVPASSAAPAATATTAPAAPRDPFEVTPQMRMGVRNAPAGAFVQMLRRGDGMLPPMKLRGLMEGPSGRIALVEVQGLGLFRVREGENIQLSPSMAVRIKRIGRDELVVNPQDLSDAPDTLVIR